MKNPRETYTSKFRYQAEFREKWKQKLKQNKKKSEILGKLAYSAGGESVTARTLDFQRWVQGQNLKQDFT